MNREPRRVQRRRVKGWRAPEGAVYVGRGTKWGNPFIATRPGEVQQEVVDAYAARFANDPALRAAARRELAGLARVRHRLVQAVRAR